MRIILPHQFTPRPYQRESNRSFFIDKKRFSVEVLHRRAGKSKNAINFILAAAMQRVGNYFHTFPELTQARRAIWNNIDKEGRRYLDHIPRKLMDGPANNTEMRIDLINGSMIQLAGADRYDALMGGNPAGIIFDEYSLQNPFAWHYLSPILTENDGWGKFIYTPRGRNHGYDLYMRNLHNPNWFVQKLDVTQTRNWDGTPIITPEAIEERRQSGMPEELIQQEFYCSFDVALANAFYSVELDKLHKAGRIKTFPIFKGVPVHSAWDLGRRDPTSIWLFQVVKDDIYLIKYYENVNKGMYFYIDWLRKYLEENNLPNGVNFAPHDINVHEWTNGRSRIDEAASMGFYFKAVPKLGVIDGINCVRALFPQFIIHEAECGLGVDSLKQYVRNENGEPVHDFASHPADALRTLGVGWHDSYNMREKLKNFTMEKWMPT